MKIATLSLVAVAALGLAACTPAATENTTTTNEIILTNSDDLVDANLTVVDPVVAENVVVDNGADAVLVTNTTTTNSN